MSKMNQHLLEAIIQELSSNDQIHETREPALHGLVILIILFPFISLFSVIIFGMHID